MDWKKKLSSRKFWVCVCGFVTAMLAFLNQSDQAAKITALIMALGTVVSYILAEGFVDAAAVGTNASATATDTASAEAGTSSAETGTSSAETGTSSAETGTATATDSSAQPEASASSTAS